MKNSYDKSVQLLCINCGDAIFEFNKDKTWIKCKRCGREYNGGYDELIELNQNENSQAIDDFKNEITKDIKDDIRNALKGNKNFKLK